MRRLVDDEVASRLRRADRRGLAVRKYLEVRELTSRIGSTDIPEILDQLAVKHDPGREKGSARPIDVVLATNMISVGVDVPRLGLMIVVGQPKATAEYIQATSRVGRELAGPGLVFTIYNWARPRDLSHYEAFEHYHATFYRHVEALSVTPFAPRALDRALSAIVAALVRDENPAWNPEPAAAIVDVTSARVREAIDAIARRGADVGADASLEADIRASAQTRLDAWAAKQKRPGAKLVYREEKGNAISLLEMPTGFDWQLWSAPDVDARRRAVREPRDPRRGPIRGPGAGVVPRGGGRSRAARDRRRRAARGRGRGARAVTMKRKEPPRVGAVRPSQLMYAFGVGSTIDLPNFSVVVAGLDSWDERNQEVLTEPRLLDAVRAELGAQVAELRSAPWLEETRNAFDEWAWTGVPVVPFPRWLRCPRCRLLAPDRLRPVPAQALRLPAGPDALRAPELHRQGQAAHGRAGALRGRLPARPPRRVPLDRVRPRQRTVQRAPVADGLRDGHGRPVHGPPGPVRDLRPEAPPVPRLRRERPAVDAEVPRPAPAPWAVRRELPGAGAGDAAGRLEQLVPDHAIGAVAPGLLGPDRAGRPGALGGVLGGCEPREPRFRVQVRAPDPGPQGLRPGRHLGRHPGAQGRRDDGLGGDRPQGPRVGPAPQPPRPPVAGLPGCARPRAAALLRPDRLRRPGGAAPRGRRAHGLHPRGRARLRGRVRRGRAPVGRAVPLGSHVGPGRRGPRRGRSSSSCPRTRSRRGWSAPPARR